ncbi:glycosyltransferase family 4 protein [Cryobacterium sp. 1639]|uniref:glycosyltransferase family 4 protein n=1 Tax=Cryobacterium inferilacus TaxID=2866629 RepID=UPI001C72AF89|nr:glycosyltransferase family 4 protein [Cryobacterium sp. 1639]MBX0301329.1 glycosyltransferase family 4 protein [Cryobacterium sp. 1639]
MVLTPDPIALWVIPVADIGGVARHVLDTARQGVPGWRLVVLCPQGPLAEELQARGAAVVTGEFGPDAGVLASVRTLRRVARALRPATVHSHLAYADIIVAATPLPAGTRRFTTEHGIAGPDAVYHGSAAKSRIMGAVHHLRLRRFDGVIAVSEATRRAMIAKWRPRQQISVIRNGVDLPEGIVPRSPAAGPSGADQALRILSLSRLAPEKRIDVLIDAFALVHAERSDATLTIAGAGPLEQSLRAQVTRAGLSGVVSFPGFVDPEEAIGAADVVVQLSVWENCSYTLLDAIARGVRVVASDVGGNAEIVPAGSLVSDPEDPAAVARTLAAIASSGVEAEWGEVDDVAVMVERTSAAYQR